jgi:deazaflavin-dependent oxidoreductase (nitroreductase family)
LFSKSTALETKETAMTAAARYVRPGRGTAFFNSVVAGFTRAGISIWGSRVLAVRGRTSGEMRTTPVNLLTVDGRRYLVAPRGVTQWVRNIRVAGEAELRLGRRVESIRVEELTDDEKPAILRPYLRRWKFEVGVFFDGVDASASDEELRQIGPKHPVFRVLAPGK